MDDVCYEVVSDALRQGYQCMVFVHSRKGTGTTARALAERAAFEGELDALFTGDSEENEARAKYADRAEKSRNKELREHFRNGMGVHHAGMLRNDRRLTEQMFNDGAIVVLCCTATLAWGINLPAHTVVIKGTDVYMPEKGKVCCFFRGRKCFCSLSLTLFLTLERRPQHTRRAANLRPRRSAPVRHLG